MAVDLICEDPRWDALNLAALAAPACAAALAEVGLDPDDWDISLLGCDDVRIAALNADFRGKPSPTNVLSWPSDERAAGIDGEMPPPPDPSDPELGDIAIAYDTCAKEAEAAAKPIAEHATHLIVHATLHLLGFDHERDGDADLMEGLESRILVAMGYADPYGEDAG
ncbi:rRNA maturation RNase YbeY [Loktanella sp. SALINAS62]|uniref:rRNA maturation RNase YbeY n=1 Tax=Loktanella sp. SALINAS62 TaxID=2706124 RepID=UPI001B8B1F10|nr:rRNA maturation RNase YbeY [Loktanella sp. SALINAS62]MBS1303212.1 rRNA maturation RNase YbeY [Loktanella sp. SALINAS62]